MTGGRGRSGGKDRKKGKPAGWLPVAAPRGWVEDTLMIAQILRFRLQHPVKMRAAGVARIDGAHTRLDVVEYSHQHTPGISLNHIIFSEAKISSSGAAGEVDKQSSGSGGSGGGGGGNVGVMWCGAVVSEIAVLLAEMAWFGSRVWLCGEDVSERGHRNPCRLARPQL
ncbi:hypothetical protein Pmani_018417 [Petrolisthes manimaculis]|uniref:Uncharacterized protein n=1 Tax=Petrolisthes manimaculis TaxID=1843537 RepID=A0AAE1U8T2_9EUCA|nr:hypothetical protein Pmani_018417 [Petrolisthes manimaculis]